MHKTLSLLLFVLSSMGAFLMNAGEFRNHGIAANAAEARGAAAVQTKSGQSLLLVNAVDCSPTAYLTTIDIDSGETRVVKTRKGIGHGTGAFGSLRSHNGKFYTGRGRVLLEFDPDSAVWTWDGIVKGGNHFMSFADENGGKRIWAAMNPSCLLVSFDPATKTVQTHGQLDKKEHYPQSLALDDKGWIYAGIGTARCNLVGYNIASGEIRQLLPEAERKHGTAVVSPRLDGTVLGVAAGKSYRLHDGALTLYEKGEKPAGRAPAGGLYYGRILRDFPDGRQIGAFDFAEKKLTVREKEKSERELRFDFASGGAQITSLATGPGGKVYASSCHPMHLACLNPATGTIEDIGYVPKIGGGNFCSMTSDGSYLYGAEYAGGRLWSYDPENKWHPGAGKREVRGLAAEELVAGGTAENGHFTYLKNHDLAFLCGDEFGAVGHFNLTAEKAGDYFVEFVPFHYSSYGRVQFEFDGRTLGEPFDPAMKDGDGKQLSFGPFNLTAGAHQLSLRTLETPGKKPWCSLATAALRPAGEASVPLVVSRPENPQILARWKDDICRPRAALMHPDGQHVLMAGFAGYGLCGGGIGIFDLKGSKAELLRAKTDLLDGHSVITLTALPGGDLVGGTSVTAPGGGKVIAQEGELLYLDWKSRKLVWHGAVVPGDRNIISITTLPDGRVAGLSSNSTFFVFDPVTKKIVHRASFKEFGNVPRHALQRDGDCLFAIMRKGILQIDPATFAPTKLGESPVSIQAGGAISQGRIYFSHLANIWSFPLPDHD